MEYYDILKEAASSVSLQFDEEKYNKFIIYMDLIKEWNEKINLTAIKDDEGIIKKHFIDCIKVFKFPILKNAKSLIDIGTGAGFPGIPIKIMYPELEVLLLDSLNKRIIFLNEVINKLELKNINAIHGRAEELAAKKEYREKFDIASSRAVANMTVLSEFCLPFVKKGGSFIAMKGPSIKEELEESSGAIKLLGGKLESIIEVDIEDTDLKHNLVVISKIKKTPNEFPRKAASIQKKPLK